MWHDKFLWKIATAARSLPPASGESFISDSVKCVVGKFPVSYHVEGRMSNFLSCESVVGLTIPKLGVIAFGLESGNRPHLAWRGKAQQFFAGYCYCGRLSGTAHSGSNPAVPRVLLSR